MKTAMTSKIAAASPEEICELFQQHMAAGDLDAVLSLYDSEAVFLNQQAESKSGQGLREELAPFAAAKATFDFHIKQVIRSGDIALMHTQWKVSGAGHSMSVYAIEVARRQPDGTWRWLIGDPFTVNR
jgi:ketosteroid isomerase-like protein